MTLPTGDSGPILTAEPPSRPVGYRPRLAAAPRFADHLPEEAGPIARPWDWRRSAVAIACSLFVHGILVLGLAGVVYQVNSSHEISNVEGVLAAPEAPVAELTMETPIDLVPGGDEAPDESEQLVAQLLDSQSRRALATTLSGIGNGVGMGEGDGAGVVAVPPVNVPGHAITKGSFSVWTEPEDPEPGEDYYIRVLVRMPSDWNPATKYRLRDISGMVTGTDGFKYTIQFKPNERVIAKEGAVQFQIFIPGSYKKVRDTIRIQSRLLKEKQVIELEF
jgi:hypothetical protein